MIVCECPRMLGVPNCAPKYKMPDDPHKHKYIHRLAYVTFFQLIIRA